MKKILNVPAWLLALAIFGQVLMVILNVHLIHNTYQQPKPWALDSTTYYKFLEGQGRLNMTLYSHQQEHEQRICKLDKKRQATHRHIDSLSGPALQQEIDRQYNNRPGRQQQTSGAGGAKDRGETDPINRGSRTPGTQGQGGSDHAAGGRIFPRHATDATTSGNFYAESNDSAIERKTAAGREPGHDCPGPGRHLPDEVARSTVGELGSTYRGGRIHNRQAQINLSYWALISNQGYTYPEIAWAISAVETGYWWSEADLVKHGHNLFGFKKSSRHVFYVSLTSTGYCRYTSQQASLADYGDYEQHVIAKYGLRSRTDYLLHIHRRYCPSPTYRGKLALALKTIKALA